MNELNCSSFAFSIDECLLIKQNFENLLDFLGHFYFLFYFCFYFLRCNLLNFLIFPPKSHKNVVISYLKRQMFMSHRPLLLGRTNGTGSRNHLAFPVELFNKILHPVTHVEMLCRNLCLVPRLGLSTQRFFRNILEMNRIFFYKIYF